MSALAGAGNAFAGKGPVYGRGQRFTFIATAGATSVSGSDVNTLTLNYNPGTELVYVNRQLLPRTSYVATSGSSITGLPAMSAGDVVEVLSLGLLLTSDTLAQSQNGADILDKPKFRANIGARAKNLVGNGRFKIDQMNSGAAYVVPSNTYGPDRWRGLIESGSVTFAAQSLNAPQVNGYFLSATANLKAGIFQPIEAMDTMGFRDTVVTLSAKIGVANLRIGTVKMAILQWTGTADAVSGNPISSWNAEGVNPTLAANWSYVNTPVNLNVSGSIAPFSVSGTVGVGMNNLAVMIWNDDKSYNANDSVIVTDVQLEAGSSATTYESLSYAEELLAAQRYLWVSNPTTPKGAGSGALAGIAILSSVLVISTRFAVPMRALPALTLWQNGTQNKFRSSTGGTQLSASIQTISSTTGGAALYYDNAAIFTVGSGYDFDLIADARI